MALVSISMTGAKYDGHASRATSACSVMKVPGVPVGLRRTLGDVLAEQDDRARAARA